MVFPIANGPGKSDLQSAVFEGKHIRFLYGESADRQQVFIRVLSVFLCDDDLGERTRWVIHGRDANKLADTYFLIYDAKRRHGWILPFVEGHLADGFSAEQLELMSTMRTFMQNGMYEPHEPLSAENVSSLRFSVVAALGWLNGVLVSASDVTVRTWE